tara:strand:- start:4989 stop:5252 length:264 start_codon:yes stop_codon:yes gene_type:complete
MNLPAVLGLFAVTALAEIVGCWLDWLWARHGAYLCRLWRRLRLDGTRLWLWAVDGIRPDRYDLLGGALMLCGVAVILIGHWGEATPA